MKIEIKSIFGSLLFECEAESLREAVVGAIEKKTYLQGANLQDAYLQCANLRGANLQGANLQGAYLRGANLQGANLRGSNLQCANLQGANLQDAYLQCANLRGAYLRGAYNIYLQCPEVGQFTAFKKCAAGRIVRLMIPEDAKRSSATSRKCRCDKAEVISIDNGKDSFDTAVSSYSSSFIYKVGEEVSVDNFCEDRWQECAEGIHFFITRKEAEEY